MEIGDLPGRSPANRGSVSKKPDYAIDPRSFMSVFSAIGAVPLPVMSDKQESHDCKPCEREENVRFPCQRENIFI